MEFDEKMGSRMGYPVDWDKRPKIVPPVSKTDKIIEVIALIGVLLSIAIVAMSAVNLSEILPNSHYLPGDVSTYWSKWPLLAVFAGPGTVIYVLITYLNMYPYIFKYPTKVTEENALRLYSISRSTMRYLKTITVWTMLTLEWFLMVLLHNPGPSGLPGLILIGSLFSVVLVIVVIHAIIKLTRESKPKTRY